MWNLNSLPWVARMKFDVNALKAQKLADEF